jgi:hypothetical protein
VKRLWFGRDSEIRGKPWEKQTRTDLRIRNPTGMRNFSSGPSEVRCAPKFELQCFRSPPRRKMSHLMFSVLFYHTIPEAVYVPSSTDQPKTPPSMPFSISKMLKSTLNHKILTPTPTHCTPQAWSYHASHLPQLSPTSTLSSPAHHLAKH